MRELDLFIFYGKQTKNKKDKTKLEHDQQMESFSLLSQQSEQPGVDKLKVKRRQIPNKQGST